MEILDENGGHRAAVAAPDALLEQLEAGRGELAIE